MRTITAEEARRYLLTVQGLQRVQGRGRAGVRRVLEDRRCIQLDPLDPIGTNADLVVLARVDGLRVGEVYDALLPGFAFEHFAKERCLLPASWFPAWRASARQVGWWKGSARRERVPEEVLADVLEEVRERGPLTVEALADRGSVRPLDWHGWRSTGRLTRMAVELLWLRCDVVVCGREGRRKVYDVPERALPRGSREETAVTGEGFLRAVLKDRVWAAGLLPRAAGPWWGQLQGVRQTLPEALVGEGVLEAVRVAGSSRGYLAPAGALETTGEDPDGRLRILGPLDPLLWDRKLVRQAFGFDYVWEVYKPAARRRWGWYVCPLLYGGELVGRLEARRIGARLRVDRVWEEREGKVPRERLIRALSRHARALGVEDVELGEAVPARLR